MTERDLERYYSAMKSRPWLYISGPMRGKKGSAAWANCGDGIRIATVAWRAGWQPIVPQLNGTWEMVTGVLDTAASDGANGWMDLDISLLTRCDALARYPGESEGADREWDLMSRVDKVTFKVPLDPIIAEFPKPTAYFDYIGGLWVKKRTGVARCGVCGRKFDNHNVRHPFVDGAYRAEGMRW